MSLSRPWFQVDATENPGVFRVRHNCDGGVGFSCSDEVSEHVAKLIELAIEEGKRRRSREIGALLGVVS